MELNEKTVKKNYIYKGRILNLRVDDALLPNSMPCIREFVEHNGGVTIAALTENNELLFVRQFRYAYGEVVLELPAGKLEIGEEPLEAGKRELEEETGAIADNYYDLGELYPSPGYTNEIIYLYAARVTGYTQQNPDEDEFLNVEKIKIEKALDMVLNNEIKDSKTQTAVLKLYMLLKKDKY